MPEALYVCKNRENNNVRPLWGRRKGVYSVNYKPKIPLGLKVEHELYH